MTGARRLKAGQALERAELTAFAPVQRPVAARAIHLGEGRGERVRLAEAGAIEAAVAVHDGPVAESDRTYAALGTVVAGRAIGVDGPIREYYPNGFDPSGVYQAEICWPVFLTSAS